jgi:hypothetical protein
MRYLGLMILCIASWAWADSPSESAWNSSVHAIKLGMSRQEVEKVLAPAKDTGVISMFAGGQLSEYKLGKLPKVTVWYDYTGATRGTDDRRNETNRVISVLFMDKKLVGGDQESEQARPANRWPVWSFDEHGFDAPPLRHRACWQKSRPSAFAPHPCDPLAPPASDC